MLRLRKTVRFFTAAAKPNGKPNAKPRVDRVRTARPQLFTTDLAGSLVDNNCGAPWVALDESFARCGVYLTREEKVREMGLSKRAHIDAIMQKPRVRKGLESHFRRELDLKGDGDAIYQAFNTKLLEILPNYSGFVPGGGDVVRKLRDMGISVAVVSGYTRAQVNRVLEANSELANFNLFTVASDEVPENARRPALGMVYKTMRHHKIVDAQNVIIGDDTQHGIQKARALGFWGVRYLDSSIYQYAPEGATPKEMQEMEHFADQEFRSSQTYPHFAISSIVCMPDVVKKVSDLLEQGIYPGDCKLEPLDFNVRPVRTFTR